MDKDNAVQHEKVLERLKGHFLVGPCTAILAACTHPSRKTESTCQTFKLETVSAHIYYYDVRAGNELQSCVRVAKFPGEAGLIAQTLQTPALTAFAFRKLGRLAIKMQSTGSNTWMDALPSAFRALT